MDSYVYEEMARMYFSFGFFFFQAEDGIRDIGVTGVQTCALPISLGTEYVAKSPADGYTLLMTSASFSFNPGLYPKLRYDSLRDFAPISQVVRVPHVIVVLPSFPAKTLQELVKLARERLGDVLYASSGAGSAMHLAGALFGVVT